MFLGGWSLPWISDAALVGGLSGVFGSDLGNVLAMAVHVGTFLFKVIFMIWFQQLVRWSLPRFRYDQVMDLGWKVMLPLSLANIVVTALALLTVDSVVR
jgi:NADH-quinone oxidoreductase subunit H